MRLNIDHSLVTSVHFMTMLEIICAYSIHVVKALQNGLLLHVSSRLDVPWHRVGSWKLAAVEIVPPQKLAGDTNQG